MKYYFAKHSEDTISFSNFPIIEEGAALYEFEVAEEDIIAVKEGRKTWVIDGGQLSTKDIEKVKEKKTEEDPEFIELRSKIETGTATTTEIQKLLSKLL